jgi:predicted N-formylglutamate amidohydrolase
MTQRLLAPDEPAPVTIGHFGRTGPFFLACDHAGRRIPASLGRLGVSEPELLRHIAWDIGIWGVSVRLARALDCFLIGQPYLRLVMDSNRPLTSPTLFPAVSESTPIPGNEGLGEAERAARIGQVFTPYHDRIEREIAARAGEELLFVAMHSFTDVYKGVARPWHAGVLFNRDRGISRIMLDLLRAEPGLTVGENEPYSVSDESDYSAPVHAERRGLPYLELEIRQDLIAGEAGQAEWAARLGRLLPEAWLRFRGGKG